MPYTVDRKLVRSWTEALDAVGERLSPRFARSEVCSRVRTYLRGLLCGVGRKNSWQLAEVAGTRHALLRPAAPPRPGQLGRRWG